ncbi:MAG TPA: NUDIX hydrolase, partial [Cyclobacteriaceae bacterium]|nr:NUDIX hydrolase [Cyclobacteriaceae bacterium]
MSLIEDRTQLINSLQHYHSTFQEEEKFKADFLDLLKHPDAYLRTHLPGHITCSAWIINAEASKCLLIHHKKLNRWLQPGGHADGDEHVLHVALKEAREETGLVSLKVLSSQIFDLDIHPIPARKSMPLHHHYDIRFLFEADEAEISQHNHEIIASAWLELANLSSDKSTEASM